MNTLKFKYHNAVIQICTAIATRHLEKISGELSIRMLVDRLVIIRDMMATEQNDDRFAELKKQAETINGAILDYRNRQKKVPKFTQK